MKMSRFNKLLLCLWLCVPLAILISGIYLWRSWVSPSVDYAALDQEAVKVSQKVGAVRSFEDIVVEVNMAEDQRQPTIKNAAGQELYLPHGISATQPAGNFVKVAEGYIRPEDAQIYAKWKYGTLSVKSDAPTKPFTYLQPTEHEQLIAEIYDLNRQIKQLQQSQPQHKELMAKIDELKEQIEQQEKPERWVWHGVWDISGKKKMEKISEEEWQELQQRQAELQQFQQWEMYTNLRFLLSQYRMEH
jgi:hypothetical protein